MDPLYDYESINSLLPEITDLNILLDSTEYIEFENIKPNTEINTNYSIKSTYIEELLKEKPSIKRNISYANYMKYEHKNKYNIINNKWKTIAHKLPKKVLKHKEQLCTHYKRQIAKQSIILLLQISFALNGIEEYNIKKGKLKSFKLKGNIFKCLIILFLPKYKYGINSQFSNYNILPEKKINSHLAWKDAWEGKCSFII